MSTSKKENAPQAKTSSRTAAPKAVVDLLYQALETEIGGVEIYRMALKCAVDTELRGEWMRYFEQTQDHVRTLEDVMRGMSLDPERETPGRQVVRCIGKSLVKAIELALGAADPAAAQVVAAECVQLAETKDHLNWGLLGKAGKTLGEGGAALLEAQMRIEDEEDEHLYHTSGWVRELWNQSLGLPAQFPPAEETEDVRTKIGAAQVDTRRTTDGEKSNSAGR